MQYKYNPQTHFRTKLNVVVFYDTRSVTNIICWFGKMYVGIVCKEEHGIC